MSGEEAEEAVLVRAKYNFTGKNNDELCFHKNDIITISQKLDGGWWEGTLDGRVGWFPHNYVTQLRPGEKNLRTKSPIGVRNMEISTLPTSQANKTVYRNMVLKDLIEAERAHVKELQSLFMEILHPLEEAKILEDKEYEELVSNLEEIIQHQLCLLQALDDNMNRPSADQRVGNEFLGSAGDLKTLLRTYCQNHPIAIQIIGKRREDIEKFLSEKGQKWRTVVAGLSQPFRHLDRYPTTLQELERNMEESHPDRGDTQRAASVYRDLANYCTQIRKQKEAQMELMSGLMEGWEGEPLETLGAIRYMGAASIRLDQADRTDRCLVLFPQVLLLLEISNKLNAYTYKMKLHLGGATLSRLETDETGQHCFEMKTPSALLQMYLISVDEANRWLEAFQDIAGLQMDDTCTLISPTQPTKFSTIQGDISPLIKPQQSVLPGPVHAEVLKKSSTLPSKLDFDHDLQMIDPGSDVEPISTICPPKQYSNHCLRPYPAPRGNFVVDPAKNNIKMRRRAAPATDQDDALVLKVVEAYCTSAMMKSNTGCADSPQLLVAEDEKLMIEETIGDEVVIQEKSLVDTVYALKDQVSSLQQEVSKLSRLVEKEQRARRRTEELLRRAGIGLRSQPVVNHHT